MRSTILFFCFTSLAILCIFQACQSERDLNYARYYTNGKQVYEMHCANCHGNDGLGLAKLYPPLTDSAFLKHNKSQLACIIKYGLKDSIKVNGVAFYGKMPAEPTMPEIDIAAVITYISNSFGNKHGLYDVDDAGADLKACQRLYENK